MNWPKVETIKEVLQLFKDEIKRMIVVGERENVNVYVNVTNPKSE